MHDVSWGVLWIGWLLLEAWWMGDVETKQFRLLVARNEMLPKRLLLKYTLIESSLMHSESQIRTSLSAWLVNAELNVDFQPSLLTVQVNVLRWMNWIRIFKRMAKRTCSSSFRSAQHAFVERESGQCNWRWIVELDFVWSFLMMIIFTLIYIYMCMIMIVQLENMLWMIWCAVAFIHQSILAKTSNNEEAPKNWNVAIFIDYNQIFGSKLIRNDDHSVMIEVLIRCDCESCLKEWRKKACTYNWERVPLICYGSSLVWRNFFVILLLVLCEFNHVTEKFQLKNHDKQSSQLGVRRISMLEFYSYNLYMKIPKYLAL